MVLLNDLKEKFVVGNTNFKSINDDLKVTIQLNNRETPNQLLEYLIGKARVNHFVEVIPSVNDIFIKTVTQNA